MLYILGVNLSGRKYVRIALPTFYGIGNTISKKICDKLNINAQYRINELTDVQKNKLIKELKKYIIDIHLRKKIKTNIEKLINIKSYRGLRHSYGLPVRGQRTRSNGKTQKFLSKKFINPLNNKKFTKPLNKKNIKYKSQEKKNINKNKNINKKKK